MEYQIDGPQTSANKEMLIDLVMIGVGGLFMFIAILLIMLMTNTGASARAETTTSAASLTELSGGKRIVHAPPGATQIDWLEQAGDIPVIVMFTAEWCGYCRDLQPVLAQKTRNTDYDLLLVEVDIDQCPALAATYNVRGIPAVRAFVHGREVDRFTGAAAAADVADFIAALPH